MNYLIKRAAPVIGICLAVHQPKKDQMQNYCPSPPCGLYAPAANSQAINFKAASKIKQIDSQSLNRSVVSKSETGKDAVLQKEFDEMANRWERESSIHSSPGEKHIHDDYIRIIGKGEQVVPLILKRLEHSKKDWLWALEHIVPEDQNPAKGIESFKEAVKAWIKWGKSK